MARTKINIQAVSSLTSNSKGEKNRVANIGTVVNNIRWSTDGRILGRNGNGGSFSAIQGSISDISYDLGRIFQMIESATNQYMQTEHQIAREGAAIGLLTSKYQREVCLSANRALFEGGYYRNKLGVIGAGAVVGTIEVGTGGLTEERKNVWRDGFFNPFGDFFGTTANIVGKVGIGGKIIDGAYDAIKGFASGDKNEAGKATVGIGKTFVSIFGDIAAESHKKADEINWKSAVFGKWAKDGVLKQVQKVTDAYPNSTKWGAAFEYDLKSSYTFKHADTVGDKIKVGTKWIGTALSAITNGIDNYSDYKDGKMSAERAVKETIMETATDVVISAAATATATVLLGASAPAVAIGAGAVLVTWAADSATKFLTKNLLGEEKDLTEFASDLALDVVKGAGDLLEKAGDGISKAIGNIGSKWRACFG